MADVNRIKDQVNLAGDKVKAAVGGALGDEKLKSAYDERREQIGDQLSQVEAFAKEKPWAALGIAAATGLVLGRLTAKRKVVYVHRVKPQGAR